MAKDDTSSIVFISSGWFMMIRARFNSGVGSFNEDIRNANVL